MHICDALSLFIYCQDQTKHERENTLYFNESTTGYTWTFRFTGFGTFS